MPSRRCCYCFLCPVLWPTAGREIFSLPWVLLFRRRLRLAALIPPVAAAGYHIYLFHRFVPEVSSPTAITPALLTTLAVMGGVVAAFLPTGLRSSS